MEKNYPGPLQQAKLFWSLLKGKEKKLKKFLILASTFYVAMAKTTIHNYYSAFGFDLINPIKGAGLFNTASDTSNQLSVPPLFIILYFITHNHGDS